MGVELSGEAGNADVVCCFARPVSVVRIFDQLTEVRNAPEKNI